MPKPTEGLKTGKVDAETGLSDAMWKAISIGFLFIGLAFLVWALVDFILSGSHR